MSTKVEVWALGPTGIEHGARQAPVAGRCLRHESATVDVVRSPYDIGSRLRIQKWRQVDRVPRTSQPLNSLANISAHLQEVIRA